MAGDGGAFPKGKRGVKMIMPPHGRVWIFSEITH